MSIEFKETTRGRAMVFVRVVVAGGTRVDALKARAQTEDGLAVPVKLIDQGAADERTLIVPQLDVPCRVLATSGDEEASFLVDPKRAKRAGQLNTLLRNADAERVRNGDTKIRRSAGNVYTTEVVPDWDAKQTIVRGIAEALVPSDSAATREKVQVVVLGRDARSLGEQTWVPLGDSVSHLEEDGGMAMRRVGFSFRVGLEPPDLIVWAKGLHSANGDVFVCLTAGEIVDRRNGFAGMTLSAMADGAYDEWFHLHCATSDELAVQRQRRFDIEPTFSLVVPLYKTPLDVFGEMARSVLGQTYSKLELVLVNASPEEAPLREAAEALVQSDSRVRVVPLEENRGITENTNAGIEVATGDFVAFLDHDDVIEPNLLYEYVRGINRHPNTDLLYCDEDKLKDGRLCEPNFKPDWDPEMLCSQNYVCHMLTVRASVLDALEPATREFDGAQDQNMTLRVGELARNVYHVRKPLYHWRISANSTAVDPAAKPYTTTAGIRSIQGHLDRLGIDAEAGQRADMPNVYQITYHIPERPLVSIVIPNKDQVPVLDRCLASIRERSTYGNYEVVVVENNSTDSETFAYYEQIQQRYDNVRVVRFESDGTFNYSKLNNFGAAHAQGDYLLLLNNDTEVISPDWLEQLLGPCTTPGVGVVGGKLLFPDGTIQHGGVAFHRAGPVHLGFHLPGGNHDYYQYYLVMRDASAVTGACLLTSRSVWDEVGGMDEDFAVNYNDVDYCLRVWEAGQRVVFQPAAELYHYESVTRGVVKSHDENVQWSAEEGLLKARYPRYYADGDPLQNPNVEGLYHHLHW